MYKGTVMLDIDGVTVRNTANHGITQPRKDLIQLSKKISQKYHFVFNTGQTIEIASAIRNFFGIKDCWAVVEHGTILYENGTGVPLIKDSHLKPYLKEREKIKQILLAEGADIKKTEMILIAELFDIERLKQIFDLIPENEIIKKSLQEIDCHINAEPKGIDKSSVFPFIKAPIMIAAGDSKSDSLMLEAAQWPIVAHENGIPNPTLVEIVERKGMGYVAKQDEPIGLGLLRGLEAAIEAGVIML